MDPHPVVELCAQVVIAWILVDALLWAMGVEL